MKIIAHRGFSDRYPENTLLAFEEALELGVDGIEADIQLSRDEEAIVFHDQSLMRIAHSNKRPEALTLDELQDLKLEGGGRIPSLDELLDLVDSRTMLILEIKYKPSNYLRLCKRIEELIHDKLAWVEVSSFEDCVLEEMHRLNKDIRLHKLINKASTLKDKAFPIPYDYIDYFDVEIKLAQIALESGLIAKQKVIFWTVEDEEITAAIEAGLYAIMTNNPQEAKEKYA